MVTNSRVVMLSVASFVFGLVLACGPNREQPVCYDVVDRTDFDPEVGEAWVCDELLPIERKYPEFTDAELVRIELPRDGACPMCPEDLDSLFWDAFLDDVERYGLASDEDPNCVDDGYAIEIACRIYRRGSDDTCVYQAYVASNCTLGPNYVP